MRKPGRVAELSLENLTNSSLVDDDMADGRSVPQYLINKEYVGNSLNETWFRAIPSNECTIYITAISKLQVVITEIIYKILV